MTNRIPFKKEEKSLALRIYDAIDATSVKKKLTDYFFIGFKMKIDERYKTQIYNVKINISTYFFWDAWLFFMIPTVIGLLVCIFELKTVFILCSILKYLWSVMDIFLQSLNVLQIFKKIYNIILHQIIINKLSIYVP